MPFIARWPHILGSKSKEVICHTDMIATAAAITGQNYPPTPARQLQSVACFSRQKTKPIREATVHQSSRRYLAIRQAIETHPRPGSGGFSAIHSEAQKGDPAQLYT